MIKNAFHLRGEILRAVRQVLDPETDPGHQGQVPVSDLEHEASPAGDSREAFVERIRAVLAA